MPKPLIFGHMLTHQNLSGNTGTVYSQKLEMFVHSSQI